MSSNYTDDKIIVYVGYPAETHASPASWVDSLLKTESLDIPNSPFRFFLSGGVVTPALLDTLKSRAPVTTTAQRMASRLSRGYTSRLIESILSSEIENILSLVTGSPLSTEYRILLDLWIMSRSDVYMVDCNLLGGARCGIESAYAQACISTVGISDIPSIDPWFQYHLDVLIKSQMCLSYLHILRNTILSSRHSIPSSKEDPPEVEEESALV